MKLLHIPWRQQLALNQLFLRLYAATYNGVTPKISVDIRTTNVAFIKFRFIYKNVFELKLVSIIPNVKLLKLVLHAKKQFYTSKLVFYFQVSFFVELVFLYRVKSEFPWQRYGIISTYTLHFVSYTFPNVPNWWYYTGQMRL